MIDWSRILELRDDVGDSEFDEIVVLFLEEVETTIGALGPDRPDLSSQLHFLKGGALNLGFEALAARCQIGEAAADAGYHARVDLGRIRAIYEASRAELTAGLEARLAN
ncbi:MULTISPECIES: Hpt domain-containing protein [unclassified Marinovum]